MSGKLPDEISCFAGWTTDEDLERVREMMKDTDNRDNPFAEKIALAIESDGDSKWSEIYNVYKPLDNDGRAICDSLMTAICGWTFHRIIEMVEKDMNH